MKPFIIPILFFFYGCVSCKQVDKDQNTKTNSSAIENITDPTILELDGRLMHADSLVFVFYNDPHGADSLRYTRFYKLYATTDTSLIHFVQQNLADKTTRYEKVKNCRSEGKIWCFSDGNIFQTIYFSSAGKECNFLQIIKNGQFYYSPLSKDLMMKLSALQLYAEHPEVQQE